VLLVYTTTYGTGRWLETTVQAHWLVRDCGKRYYLLHNQIDDNGKPTGVPQRFKNEIPELIKKTVKKTDFGAVFASMCETETYLPTPTAVPISMEQEELPF
jgi:hypothetical protein